MISLDYLKTLIEFEKTGGVAQAAKSLGLSQPAVTKQLQILDSSFGNKSIFMTKGTKKILSPFGRTLYNNCQPLIDQLQSQINTVKSENTSPPLKIAGRDMIMETLLKRIVDFPGSFEIISCSSAEASEKILEQSVDIAISYHVPHSGDLIAKKLFESVPLICFSPQHFPFLKDKDWNSLDATHLRRCNILSYKKDESALAHLCKSKNLSLSDLNFTMITQNWSLIREATLQGSGIAVLPSEYVANSKLATIDFDRNKPFSFQYYMIYAKSLTKTDLGRKWLSSLK